MPFGTANNAGRALGNWRSDAIARRVRLASRNLARQKSRAGVTLAAIAVGVVSLVLSGGFVQDVYLQLAETFIHSQSGHLQVASPGFFEHGAKKPERYLLSDPKSAMAALAQNQKIKAVMARLSFVGLLNNGRTDLPIVGEGMEPAKEQELGTFLRISAGRFLTGQDRFGVLVGQGLANTLKLKPGDTVTLLANTGEGAINTLDLNVTGIFQSFSKEYDARAVKISLEAAQELLLTSGASVLAIELHRTSDTEGVARSLRHPGAASGLEIKTWRDLNDFYEKTVMLYERLFGVLRLIVLAMVVLGVVNAVNMNIFERLGEFGTLRALGDTGSNIFWLVVTECLLLGVAGTVLGLLCGWGLAHLISSVGISMPPPPNSDIGYTARIQVLTPVLVGAAVIGVLAPFVAALIPALRAARMPVVEALRRTV
jgi:putative ABC transport system permease protein